MSDSDNLTPRQQRAAERILEDEGLAGGLTDEPAARLVRWAGEAAVRAAAPERSDEQTSALLGAIRQAARQAARQAPAEGQDVVDLAQTILGASAPELAGAPAPTPDPQLLTPESPPRRIASLRARLISLLTHRPD